MIQCPICNKSMNQITNSHLKTHGLTTTEFKSLYPNTFLLSPQLHQKYKTNSQIYKEKNSRRLHITFYKKSIGLKIENILTNISICKLCKKKF